MKKHTWFYILCILVVHQLAFASARSDGENSSDEEVFERSQRRITKAASSSTKVTSSSHDPYATKTRNTDVKTKIAQGYYDARLITFGTHLFVRNIADYDLRAECDDPTQSKLYRKDPHMDSSHTPSQLLFTGANTSLGTSVSTSIKTTTARDDERKTTFIQYDKADVIQAGKDFLVDAQNEKGTANYDGGHLTDHKFSAEGSHTDAFNYIPQHHAYNRWIKESIVKQKTGKAASSNVEGYLEIPLYTPNPPEIKVSGENRSDKIPVGIILVALKNQAILDAYYFPNNQYNYHALQRSLRLRRLSGGKIAPYFRLKRALHPLLMPAIIYDGRQHADLQRAQTSTEAQRVYTVDALVDGMSTLDLDDEETTHTRPGLLRALAKEVSQKDNITLSLLLEHEEDVNFLDKGQPNQNALQQAFNVFGQFLVHYAVENALKSEVISPRIRINLFETLIDFTLGYWIYEGQKESEKAFECIYDGYIKYFDKILEELESSVETMTIRDTICFSEAYQKLYSDDTMAADVNGYPLGKNSPPPSDWFSRYMDRVLKPLYRKTETLMASGHVLTPQEKQDLRFLFNEAQGHIDDLIEEEGFSKEDFEDTYQFLNEAEERIQSWKEYPR